MRFLVLLIAFAAGLASPALPASILVGVGVPAMTISATPTTSGTIDLAITPFTVTSAYGAPAVTFSLVSGAFPTGVTLNATTGVVSGTPSTGGTFADIVIGAEDSFTPGGHRTALLDPFTMVIQTPASNVLVSATPTTTSTVATLATPFTVSASGGTGPYTYAVAARYLPSGVTLHATTGVVSGTPTQDGTYADIVISATDNIGAVGYLAAFTWKVNAASPAVALSLTNTTPVNYIFDGGLTSGAIRTAHGLTVNPRASANPGYELDADGNSKGAIYYGYTQTGSATPDWPPGYPTPDYSNAPLTVNSNTTYPFRFNFSSALPTHTAEIRGGRIIGSISSDMLQIHMSLYPYETTSGNAPYIVTPQAVPACYAGALSPAIYPTWVNANATGTNGSFTLTTIGQPANANMFVGQEISSPAGTTGIQAGTVVLSMAGTHTLTLDKALTANVSKFTARGCTSFYQNSAGFLIDQVGVNYKADRMRLDHVWDGIRTCGSIQHTTAKETTAPCNSIVTGVWMTHFRDDGIENDNNWPLVVTDTLMDEGYVGISADQTQSPSVELTMKMVLNGVIMHISSRPDESDNPTPPHTSYGLPFKTGTGAPSIELHSTIIAVDNASTTRLSRYTSAWQRMTNGYGSCVDSTLNSITGLTGNYFLWLDDVAPTTAQIGDMANPASTVRTTCFPGSQYQTGATARATLAAAIAAWQVAHPWIYRLSSDP